ncbi:hypothetical protein DAPPUDRAFT_258205 [Daphnia pulex]|uniref:Uncharacterized protein n=1 Tax=Daphnia pulex TaxID=6669 RepID=E9HEY8_DAPPU|nr:hypothetical protein DAPPUDRAFT_258205 [Daphnia pulex]|eukprot:EFX69702.1 hypothetical protein DAPPUDRAFT_258205 [Daphnia pulex]
MELLQASRAELPPSSSSSSSSSDSSSLELDESCEGLRNAVNFERNKTPGGFNYGIVKSTLLQILSNKYLDITINGILRVENISTT